MREFWKRAGRVAIPAGLIVLFGCGESTNVTLAKVPPVASGPEGPKPAPKGKNGSPAVLPGPKD